MLFVGLGVLAVIWAAGSESDFFVRVVVGILGLLLVGVSIKAYNLRKPPKLQKEY